jgi:hypothetical protein
MAQLNGVMAADFSDFHFEIDKSVTKLKELEGATGHTAGSMDDFTEGLGAVDKTLGLFGIRIGPQIQALREFSGVLGSSTSALGTWGTAAAAAGAFAAGWKIGSWINEWTGLSDAIGDAAASLLGWGDAGLEAARAKIDLFARASNIAGREIRDVGQAMEIVKKHNADVAESFNTGTVRLEGWNREIAKHRDVLPTIVSELKNHSSTVQQLATHYGISKEAIEHYVRTLENSTKAQKAWADEARPKYEAIAKAQADLTQATGGWHAMLLTITPTVAKTATEALGLGVAQTTVAQALNLSALQVDALDRQMKLNLATMAATEPALGTLDQWIKTNVADVQQWNTEWRFTSEVIGDQVIPALDAVTAKAQTTSAAIAAAVSIAPGMDQKSPGNAPVPINTGNISYGTLGSFEATFAEYQRRHPSGGMLGGAIGGGPPADFLTWALSMGLAQRGPTITNTFNIVDTQDGIARKVGDTITSQVQRGSLVN